MSTYEFIIGTRRMASVLMNAEDQWQLARRAEQMLPAIDNATTARFSHGPMTIDRLFASFGPMAGMDDDDAEAFVDLCLGACQIYQPPTPEDRLLGGRGEWSPIARAEFDLPEVLQVMAHVVMHNLGPLYAMERPSFARTGGGAEYQPVHMPDRSEWLFRPALRGMCDARGLRNGDLRIEYVAKLNDVLDVAEENERRAYKAAEGKA